MKKTTKWVTCVALCADGTRCGKSADAKLRLCHIHLAQQQRAAGTAPPDPNHFTPSIRTPREVLERIANNDKHPQQVQAARALIDLNQQQCAKCAAREHAEHLIDETTWSRLTDDQRRRARRIYDLAIARLNAFKALAKRQPKREEPGPDDVPQHVLDRWAEEDAAQPVAPIASVTPEENVDEIEAEEEEEITGPVEVEIEAADGQILGTIVVPADEYEIEDEDLDG